MTTLYQNNFDAETTGALPAGWVNGTGSWTVGTTRPVSGAKSFGASGDGNNVLYTGIAAAADMRVKVKFQVLVSGGGIATISPLLRFSADRQSGYKAILIAGNTSSLNVLLQKVVGGSASQVGSVTTNALTGLANGDVINVEAEIIGSTVNIYASTNANAVSLVASFSDSTITAAGYAGMENVLYLAGTAATADDFFVNDTASAATGVTLTGPTTGTTGSASTNFTVGVAPSGGAITGTVVITPSDGGAGGAFLPSSVSLTTASPSGTFTYTAASSGAKTISVANNGSLTTPSNITYTATSSAATSTVVSGPSTGVSGVASSNFTVSANGIITGTVVVTPGDGGAGGAFTPATVSISSGTPTGTFTYTPASTGSKTLTFVNSGGLSNQANLTYGSTAPQMSLIRFSPGNWNITSSRATSINPGAYFRTLFDGTSCSLQFDVTNNSGTQPKIWYRIGGYGAWTLTDIAASVPISLAGVDSNFASNGGYLLEVVFKEFNGGVANRWGPTPQSAVILTGITAGNLTLPPVAYARKGLFFGDSIFEGVLLTPGGAQDAMQSWASEVGRHMAMEYGIVGFASQGFTQVGQCGVPVFGSTWDKIYSGVARDFTGIDYIFICQGQNDSGGNLTSVATSVLNATLSVVPSTTKIILAAPLSQLSAASLQAAVAAINNPRLMFMDTAGFKITSQVHPYINENLTRIAPSFVNSAQALLAGAPATTARTASITLGLDASTLAANLTGLSWTYQDTYNGAVLSSGTTGTTNSSGVFSQSVQTTLASGGSGKIKIEGAAGLHYNGTVVVA